MEEVKATKKDCFATLRTLVEAAGNNEYDYLLEFIDKEVNTLEARAEKAKERAEKKKAEGDEFRATVYELVTDEPQTLDQLVVALDDPEVSRQKIVARLTQLVKSGFVEKDLVKDGKRKVTTYKRVAADAE